MTATTKTQQQSTTTPAGQRFDLDGQRADAAPSLLLSPRSSRHRSPSIASPSRQSARSSPVKGEKSTAQEPKEEEEEGEVKKSRSKKRGRKSGSRSRSKKKRPQKPRPPRLVQLKVEESFNESNDSFKDPTAQLIPRKYIGRRGRRKGSFHLKRDLVSYRDIALQRVNGGPLLGSESSFTNACFRVAANHNNTEASSNAGATTLSIDVGDPKQSSDRISAESENNSITIADQINDYPTTTITLHSSSTRNLRHSTNSSLNSPLLNEELSQQQEPQPHDLSEEDEEVIDILEDIMRRKTVSDWWDAPNQPISKAFISLSRRENKHSSRNFWRKIRKMKSKLEVLRRCRRKRWRRPRIEVNQENQRKGQPNSDHVKGEDDIRRQKSTRMMSRVSLRSRRRKTMLFY